jgi:kynurenine formamidase
MVTYPGLPGPVICDYLSREASRTRYAPGVEFHIGRIDMVANTGTYIDAPFHRFADAMDVAGLPLDVVAGLEAVVVRAEPGPSRAIGPEVFDGLDLEGKAVLVHTGWSRFWRTERYLAGHPFLTAKSAEHLLAAGARLVGIDSLNIDDTDDIARPVHSTLLGAEVPIVEHLTHLAAVPAGGFRFFAVPPKVVAFGTFSVRAFAEVPAPRPAGGGDRGGV